MGIDDVLARARGGIERLEPRAVLPALAEGALFVDTRTAAQRLIQGDLPGAIVIDRTVLEWRLDPASVSRIPEADSYDRQVIVVCRQGYSSSLAAASLREVGLHRTTDLAGGVEAWTAAGLPLQPYGTADVRT